ncbi:unnamed protein product [Colias eurytheme]|nr:unnamed protein product [Colias eurytheme]
MNIIGTLMGDVAEIQLKTDEVQKILKKKKDAYDLLLIEDCAEPYYLLSHLFKAPLIVISSMGLSFSSNQLVGSPGNIFVYPTMLNQRVYNLTFWEKVEELYKYYKVTNAWRSIQDEQLKRMKHVLDHDVPTYSELNKNVDMVFMNMHPLWTNNAPLPPNIINIWGIHKKPEKALPQDLQSYLDSSKNGVIYLSFGSNVPFSLLPPQTIQLFINVFSKLPYDVLWKWEKDELPGKSDNIRISKWLPQSDLLRHPKIKLFITQGGLQSTDEAITAGVPLVGIPMLGDQWYNVDYYRYHRIGVVLEFETLSVDALDKAINTVVNDKSYRENILRLRSIMKDQPQSALDRAVWWTEYVLRHGGAKHLRAAGAYKNWAEYYDIDFISKFVALIIFIVAELVRRGHEVTVLTTDPVFKKENSPANLTEIDVHDVSYKVWREKLMGHGTGFGEKNGLYKQVKVIGSLMGDVAEIQWKTPEVQKILKKKKDAYDLLIIEECVEPYLVFTQLFEAPVISISSMGMMINADQIFGTPGHLFLYPTMLHQRVYNLTFWEKLDELYKNYKLTKDWKAIQEEQKKSFKQILGYDVHPYSELYKNIDMLFVNIHPLWTNNPPLPPNIISIWGIHKKPEKALPQDLQAYLDSSKNGVIYLSFGSNVPSSLLPAETIQLFINVFSKLPYDVLWKWEKDELPGKSENIRISKWLPQSDLLRHPKIKLFITQGGLQSTDEAITAGVPLVGIPMLGDQWYNVDYYMYHRIGVRLDFHEISEDAFDKAIKTVINDKSYRENILRLRSIMKDQPESALERAVWWTEYVLRHGGAKHLRAAGANKTWAEYYDIEFISKLTLLVISIVAVSVYVLYFFLSLVPKTKSKIS